jgi:hypothetical protein
MPTQEEMLAAITKHTQTLSDARKEELRGPAGPRGPEGAPGRPGKDAAPARDGKDGRDGKDAKPPEIVVGDVSIGNKAAASFIRDANGVHVLNLVLPRGERGERGERGFDGADSQVPGPPGKDSTVPGPRGSDGADSQVPGPTGSEGPEGKSGMDREEIANIIIEVLQHSGVMSDQAAKLVAVRAALRKTIHEVDAHHISELSNIIRKVDQLF